MRIRTACGFVTNLRQPHTGNSFPISHLDRITPLAPRARTLFANALDVRFLEAYGQVAVADPKSHAPLARVYVKCFARLRDGSVRFHKDGYTDLRGRFDYASISNDPDLEADRYAVLVLSDEFGADIRELAPPAR